MPPRGDKTLAEIEASDAATAAAAVPPELAEATAAAGDGQVVVTANVKIFDLEVGVPTPMDDSVELRSAARVGLVTIAK